MKRPINVSRMIPRGRRSSDARRKYSFRPYIYIFVLLVAVLAARPSTAQFASQNETRDWAGVQIGHTVGSATFSATDGAGGMISVWNGNLPGFAQTEAFGDILFANGLRKFYAPRFASAEPRGGVMLSTNSDMKTGPLCATDAVGGFFAVWLDHPAGSGPFVYAQHVSTIGARDFGNTGINLTPNGLNQKDGANIYGYWITETIPNHALVVVDVEGPGTPRGDVWAILLDQNGVVWSTRVTNTGAAENPYVIHDGNGGGVIGWTNHPSFGNTDVYGEVVNSAGQLTWNPALNGKPIANTPANERLEAFDITCASGVANPLFVYNTDEDPLLTYNYKVGSFVHGTGAFSWRLSFPATQFRSCVRSIADVGGGAYVSSIALDVFGNPSVVQVFYVGVLGVTSNFLCKILKG